MSSSSSLDYLVNILIFILGKEEAVDSIEITPARPRNKAVLDLKETSDIVRNKTLEYNESVRNLHYHNRTRLAELVPLRAKRAALDEQIMTHMTNTAVRHKVQGDTLLSLEQHSLPGDVKRSEFITALKDALLEVFVSESESDALTIDCLTPENLIKIEASLERKIDKIRDDNTTFEMKLIEKKLG